MSSVQLFGQHLWKPTKRVVVCEGEVDALSYHAVTKSWPVVSIPNGCQSAKRAIANNIEWLEGFEEVCFMFDNDEQGQKAAKECAELLSRKASIAQLGKYKDANEMLALANAVKELVQSVYTATVHRPDGVLNGKEIWDVVRQPVTMGATYCFRSFNDALFGFHKSTIVTLTAGSGVGKSTIAASDCLFVGYR